MNAQAYATGNSVAFAHEPDLHTAAHEAAHVVQQRGGVSLKGGVGQNGDMYEQHADAVADAVVAGRSAETLLDEHAGDGRGRSGAVQRKPNPPTGKAAGDEGATAGDAGAQSLDDLVANLDKAATDKARKAAVDALTTWCRSNLVDESKMAAYLARADISGVAKTKTLGELRVAIARNEFLLGWSHLGGVDKGGESGWETTPVGGKTPKNKGPYPSHYLGEVGAADGQEWCTSFAGHTHTRLGFEPGARDEKAFKSDKSWRTASGSVFWSGYRLRKWSRDGEENGGRSLTPADDVVKAGKGGSMLIDYPVWSRLKTSLGKAKEDARGEAVDKALEGKGTPQAGDMLILGKNNDFKRGAKSHTAMVESYDAETRTIYTIEGNTGQAVRGRKFDLTDPDIVSQIISIVRVGADFFPAAGDTEAAPPTEPASDVEVGSKDQATGEPAPSPHDPAPAPVAEKAGADSAGAACREPGYWIHPRAAKRIG